MYDQPLEQTLKSLEALLEINDKDLFKGLGVRKLETQAKTHWCSKEEGKVKGFLLLKMHS